MSNPDFYYSHEPECKHIEFHFGNIVLGSGDNLDGLPERMKAQVVATKAEMKTRLAEFDAELTAAAKRYHDAATMSQEHIAVARQALREALVRAGLLPEDADGEQEKSVRDD
jgi:hypothetical protein